MERAGPNAADPAGSVRPSAILRPPGTRQWGFKPLQRFPRRQDGIEPFPRIAAVLLLTTLTACGQTPIPKLVTRDPPPVEMTQCQEEPPKPDAFPDEASRYAWAAGAIFAGRDCRARLAALKSWALEDWILAGPAAGKGK